MGSVETGLALRMIRRPSAQSIAAAVAAILVVAAVSGSAAFVHVLGLPADASEFSLPEWEARNSSAKWLYKFGLLFRDKPSVEAENEAIFRFLSLTRAIDRLQEQTPDGAEAARQLEAMTAARAKIESLVEAAIEGRITAVAEREGLKRSIPVLPDIVWPPVDMAFTDPPRTLAVSPRDRIVLESTTLLRPDLSLSEVERIETEREKKGDVSALAFPTEGIGAYPTIVGYTSEYARAVEVAAHEWVHNYLAFRPLGVHYYASANLRTINETVATIAGQEFAALITKEWPIPSLPPQDSARPSIDVRAELSAVRRRVDALLAEGKVEEAEAFMEEQRQYLAAHGFRLRKLNQAYFAFVNLYAGRSGSPGATNPVGPKVDELRRRTGSLGAFLRVAGTITSVDSLDRALAERE